MLTIQQLRIADHYPLIESMMRGLHESERELFDKTAPWDEVSERYMRHVIETQEEYEGTCLVAYVDGQAAGFIFGYIENADDDSRIEAYTGLQLYVSDGWVDPAFRRLGLYRKLNAELERIYTTRGIRRIERFTLTSNLRMQHFLESEGYTATRLVYEKWLSPDASEVLPLGLNPPEKQA